MATKVLIKLFPPGYSFGAKETLSSLKKDEIKPDEIVYIVPTERKVKYVLQDIIEIFKPNVLILPKVYTLKSIGEKICIQYQNLSIIGNLEKYIFLGSIVKEIQGVDLRPGFYNLFCEFNRLIKHYLKGDIKRLENAFEEEIDELKKNFHNFLNLFKMYQTLLTKKNLIDEEGIFLKTKGYADRVAKNKIVVFDGFYDLTEVEKEFVKELVIHSKYSIALIPNHKVSKEIKNFFSSFENAKIEEMEVKEKNVEKFQKKALSREDEVVEIARTVAEFLRKEKTPPEEIIVTFPAMETYIPKVRRIFKAYNIPYYISLKKRMKSYPSIRIVLSLLKVIREEYLRRDVVNVITSPFFQFSTQSKQWIDLISRRLGIVKEKSWEILSEPEIWKSLVKEDTSEEDIQKIKDTIRKINKDYQFLKKVTQGLREKSKMPLSKFVRRLRETLGKLKWDPLDENLKLKFYTLLERLESAEEIIEKPYLMDLSRFQNVLEFSLEQERWEKEEKEEGVKVLGILETKGLPAQYLLGGGFVDGEFPKREERNLLFPDRIKERLKIPTHRRIKELEEFDFQRLLNLPQKGCFLTFPSMEHEKLLLPSIFLENNKDAKDWQIPEENVYCSEEALRYEALPKKEIEPPKFDVKSISSLKNKLGDKGEFSITSLERYGRCPYFYYLKEIIELSPFEEPTEEPEKILLGSIVHRIFRKIFATQFPVKDLAKIIREAATAELAKGRSTILFKEWIISWIEKRIEGIVDIEQEEREKGFSPCPWLLEKPLQADFGKFWLKGRVDRVDTKDNQAIVLDYKTGKSPSFSDFKKGLTLQLPLYSLLIEKELKKEVVDFAFYSLENEPKLKKYGDRIKELKLEAKKIMEEFIDSIYKGRFQRAEDRERCYGCEFKDLCR